VISAVVIGAYCALVVALAVGVWRSGRHREFDAVERRERALETLRRAYDETEAGE
jgi:hypothetical protein